MDVKHKKSLKKKNSKKSVKIDTGFFGSCHECQAFGHRARECPQKQQDYHDSFQSVEEGAEKKHGRQQKIDTRFLFFGCCHKCKAFGHRGKDCPQQEQQYQGSFQQQPMHMLPAPAMQPCLPALPTPSPQAKQQLTNVNGQVFAIAPQDKQALRNLAEEKMRRQSQYENSYAAQMQQISAQRMRHGSGMANFPGRTDALPGDEERPYISSKAEGQWQWERDMTKGSNPIPSQIFGEGERGDASRSFHSEQRPDSKTGVEKQANKDPRAQPLEQDMEIGYEENTLPQTFEGLEQKFHDEILKLTKEQHDAEDAENARHRERVGEINAKYQEKLTSLRAEHATRRDDFLRRESQARHQQYQQAGIGHYQSAAGASEPHGYGGAGAAAAAMAAEAAGEARRAFVAGQYDSFRERAQYLEGARSHGFESRGGPYPGGRSYNNNARFY